VALLSGLLCLANVFKPLVIDDAAYYAYAAHIAEHPLDPYGFTIFWYQQPQPAFEVLAPPVFPYWWSLGIRLFGDSPVLWKLWLWPWCVLFAAAVVELCRRFARPVAVPMPWFIVCSPTVLPALNLMLDIPVLALGLSAVALFFRARVAGHVGSAILVGVLTAAAMQTKYTALVTPVVLVAAASATPRHRRGRAIRRALVAVTVAAALFCGWELFVARKYGSSHFLEHAARATEPWRRKLLLFWPLVGILGGVGAPLVALGLAAFRIRRPGFGFVIGLIAASWIAFASIPAQTTPGDWNVATALFGWIGALAFGAMIFASSRPPDRRGRFLAGWWLLELCGYFILSPWAAVRRVIGLSIVGALVLARRIGPTPDSQTRSRVRYAAALSVGLGVMFQVIDTSDAVAERTAVEDTARQLAAPDPGAEVWYTGHLGMQFCADRAHWRRVVPGESRLPAGSRLVLPDRAYGRQSIELPVDAREEFILEVSTPWPLQTIPAYYRGHKAIERSTGATVKMRVFRIAAPCTPQPARAKDFGDESLRRRH
jgi:hypothetical protein